MTTGWSKIPARKFLALTAAILALSFLLVACGGFDRKETARPSTTQERTPTPPTGATPGLPIEVAVQERPAALVATKSAIADQDRKVGGAVGNFAPEFGGIDAWINSGPLTMEELHGNVVLIDFWTYTCINCIHTYPFLKEMHAKYADDGLVIVGVHTPEFEFEKEYDNVLEATQKDALVWPMAQDNDYITWRRYSNRYWPAEYLIDKDGIVRYTHFGEGAYAETEAVIRQLLAELNSTPQ